MTYSDGQALLLHAITNTMRSTGKNYVRSADLVNATGYSRQLVYHHMQQLAKRGFIENFGGGVYGNANLDLINDEIHNAIEAKTVNRPTATALINEWKAARLNALIDLYLILHRYVPEGKDPNLALDATPIKKKVLRDIDESINMLRGVKKHVNRLRPVAKSSRWNRLKYKRRNVYKIWDDSGEVSLFDWPEIFPEEIKEVIGD